MIKLKCVEFLFVISVIISIVYTQSFTNDFNQLRKIVERESRGDFVIKYPEDDDNRRQKNYPDSFKFPCKDGIKDGRSSIKPKSVHKLRPGDIDVIAAMGDSLVAGNGALEEWALGTMIENRGVSWCAGGQGTWRQYLTLPNILKVFNQNLTGYSIGTGEFLSTNAQLNVAYPVAADADALRQAKILVKKIKETKRINFKEDWKMITVFFGANDLCSAQCYDKERGSARSHGIKLAIALDYLQNNLPRTFVNLIPVLDVSVSVRVDRSMMCRVLHMLFCGCFHATTDPNPMSTLIRLTREYQQMELDLIRSGRYDKTDDFTVVIQPFMKLFNAPTDPGRQLEKVINSSYITHDCFHFSQKGHAFGANLLWNNLLEPIGGKSLKRLNYILEKFNCPTDNAPYLFTNRNSKIFLETGHQ